MKKVKMTMQEIKEMVGIYGLDKPSINTGILLKWEGLEHWLEKDGKKLANVYGLLGANKLTDIIDVEYQ